MIKTCICGYSIACVHYRHKKNVTPNRLIEFTNGIMVGNTAASTESAESPLYTARQSSTHF